MVALFSTVLALVVLFLVGYPLFRGYSGRGFSEAEPSRSLVNEKEVIMSTLGEIEFDYHMKKLSEEDYHTLKHTYASAAVEIFKAQDEMAVKGKTKDKTKGRTAEANVAAIEREIEAELAALSKRGKAKANCHHCGSVLKEAGQEYCHSCGERQF